MPDYLYKIHEHMGMQNFTTDTMTNIKELGFVLINFSGVKL